jgi:hypothetical protein
MLDSRKGYDNSSIAMQKEKRLLLLRFKKTQGNKLSRNKLMKKYFPVFM